MHEGVGWWRKKQRAPKSGQWRDPKGKRSGRRWRSFFPRSQPRRIYYPLDIHHIYNALQIEREEKIIYCITKPIALTASWIIKRPALCHIHSLVAMQDFFSQIRRLHADILRAPPLAYWIGKINVGADEISTGDYLDLFDSRSICDWCAIKHSIYSAALSEWNLFNIACFLSSAAMHARAWKLLSFYANT